MEPALSRLLKEDPMGKLFRKAERASQPFLKRMAEGYPRVKQALAAAQRVPELRTKLDFSPRGLVASALVLGVDYRELKSYFDLKATLVKRRAVAVNYEALRRSGTALLQHSPVLKIRDGRMPWFEDRSFIVLWSADWCFWCKLVIPTFARLSRHFSSCSLFFCDDEELRRREGIKFIPQLAVYLPEGGRVTSECGSTTTELWKVMNSLADLGPGFQGRGVLVCTETECRIEPEE